MSECPQCGSKDFTTNSASTIFCANCRLSTTRKGYTEILPGHLKLFHDLRSRLAAAELVVQAARNIRSTILWNDICGENVPDPRTTPHLVDLLRAIDEYDARKP